MSIDTRFVEKMIDNVKGPGDPYKGETHEPFFIDKRLKSLNVKGYGTIFEGLKINYGCTNPHPRMFVDEYKDTSSVVRTILEVKDGFEHKQSHIGVFYVEGDNLVFGESTEREENVSLDYFLDPRYGVEDVADAPKYLMTRKTYFTNGDLSAVLESLHAGEWTGNPIFCEKVSIEIDDTFVTLAVIHYANGEPDFMITYKDGRAFEMIGTENIAKLSGEFERISNAFRARVIPQRIKGEPINAFDIASDDGQYTILSSKRTARS